jgi:two-component system nitrate/nitrite response regulator NarL
MEQSGIRVLVVDDFKDWCLLLCSMLQSKQKFQVVGLALNGLEAIERAKELQPDLILLDIGLPGLNGIETAHKIAQLSPQSKILFVSENQDPDVVQEALRSGAIGYIFKSRVATELFPAIDAALGHSSLLTDNSIPRQTSE